MKMEFVTVPSLNCSFPVTANPKESECLQNLEQWVKPSLSGDQNQKFVALVSRAMPQASLDYLIFASKALFLEDFFSQIINNVNGQRLETIERLKDVVEKIAANDWNSVGELTPFEKTAAEIVSSGKQFLNEDFEKRFLMKLIFYLKAISTLENQRQKGHLPSLTELLTLRQCASSTEMLIELCEAGMNICMSDENRCDSVIQRMVKTVIKIIFIGKDLASFDATNDYSTNVVNAMKRSRNYDWQQAVDETIELYVNEQAALKALEKLVDTDEMQDGKVVKKYMKILKFVVKAMHEFHGLSKERKVRIQ